MVLIKNDPTKKYFFYIDATIFIVLRCNPTRKSPSKTYGIYYEKTKPKHSTNGILNIATQSGPYLIPFNFYCNLHSI